MELDIRGWQFLGIRQFSYEDAKGKTHHVNRIDYKKGDALVGADYVGSRLKDAFNACKVRIALDSNSTIL